MKTVYFGRQADVAQKLYALTNLSLVLCDTAPTKELAVFCRDNSVPLHTVQSNEEIQNIIIKENLHSHVCFVAIFGIILSQSVINSFKTIINFHTGDIFICRGRHPIVATVLKKIPMMCITAHIINSPSIDAGPIIAQQFIPINYDETYGKNESTLLSLIPHFIDSVIRADLVHRAPYTWFIPSEHPYNKNPSAGLIKSLRDANSLRDFLDNKR